MFKRSIMARWSIMFISASAVQSFVTRNSLFLPRAFGQSAPTPSPLPLFSFLGRARRNFGGAASCADGAVAFNTPSGLARPTNGRRKNALARLFSSATSEQSTADAQSASAASATMVVADDADFVKPDRDQREYRYVKLANNLEVLLVSTAKAASGQTSTVEAASIHVQAGHFDDTIAGLAHFHEHMLFLGTEKYPEEDAYESFLSKFGGSGNAYTDMEDTNYYFSVTSECGHDIDTISEGLSGGLDRLSQFFIAPKFESGMVERELRAIDSEYRNYRTNDAWRNYQFLKEISNQEHPFSNFGCGNYETLTSEGSPEGLLRKFWSKYYTTSNMRLSVAGCSSLDALQRIVEDTFGKVAYSDEPPRRVKSNPNSPVFPREHAVYGPENPAFGTDQLGKIREVVPLLEARSLKVMFATPPMEDPVLKRTKPHRVISHLLGHESPGSLHSLLNDMGYVVGLTSGTPIDSSDFSLFSVSLSLTPKGMEAKDEVLSLIFQYLALIRTTLLSDPDLMVKYHNELRQMSANQFKFRENGDPTDFCSSAADVMFDTDMPKNELLVAGSKCDEYDQKVAEVFMDRLRPQNCMVTITDSGLISQAEDANDDGEWKTEKWYGANYRTSDISQEQMEQWETPSTIHPALHVPALNQFIPSDFSLRCDDDEEHATMTMAQREANKKVPPTLVHEQPGFRMWHKMDKSWRVPKTTIRFATMSPIPYSSPRSITLSRIFQRVLNDDLNSFVYDASIAGCNYNVACSPTGYSLSVRGYSEKLPALLETLTTRIRSLIDEMKEGSDKHPSLQALFLKAKENLLRETRNYRLDAPYEVCMYNSRLIMEQNVWYIENYMDEMEGELADAHPLTLEECAVVAEHSLTGRIIGDAICFGNIDKDGTRQVLDVIDKQFLKSSRPLHEAEMLSFRSMKLPTKQEAVVIFGAEMENANFPIKYQELAFSESEENNAVEATFQVGCNLFLGYEGIAALDLLASMAYNSAYVQLRTREQLGYIVSAFTRKTAGGAWGITIIVQSSSTLPEVLEERVEEWLKTFRKELEEMDPAAVAAEAKGVMTQLTEGPTKMSSEATLFWGEIVATQGYGDDASSPPFDRIKKLADELTLASANADSDDVNGAGDSNIDGDGDQPSDLSPTTMAGNARKTPEMLKERLIEIFDTYLATDAPERRAMISRVYNHTSTKDYEATSNDPGVMTSYSDIRNLKQYLSTWPMAPYWR